MTDQKKEKIVLKVDRMVDKILTLKPDFTGSVEFNFFKGGITNVNIRQTNNDFAIKEIALLVI